jgi:hypothetical protein
VVPSSRVTPYGFDFRADGILVVTEAFGGQVGAAAASSYRLNGAMAPVSASVQNTRSEVCWAAVSKDGQFAYVTNFGDKGHQRRPLVKALVDPNSRDVFAVQPQIVPANRVAVLSP